MGSVRVDANVRHGGLDELEMFFWLARVENRQGKCERVFVALLYTMRRKAGATQMRSV